MNIGNIGPHMLHSMRSRSLGWSAALGELIDNSFDASATRVELDFSKSSRLVVSDDGSGCPNVERMLTIADHMPSKGTSLGRYGVGLKDAACWLWGEMLVESVYRGQAIMARVNWNKLSRQSDWEIPDPIKYDPTDEMPIGTRIQFLNHGRNRPNLEKLIAELGYVFWPALTQGRQVVISGPRRFRQVCAAWKQPPLTDVVEDAFAVDGKQVALRAGIVPPDDTNARSGFNIAYGHRNICNTSLGSNGLSTNRICGVVTLGNGWRLSTNKTEVCDDQERLAEALWERCSGILEKSQTQAESIYNRELEMSVSEKLRAYLESKKRARRGRGDSEGSVTPKGSGKKHRRARKTQDKPGNIEDRIEVGKLRMEWRPREDGRLGHVDLPGSVVYLNSEHGRLKQHKEADNREALVDSCLTLVTSEAFDSTEREKFPWARDYESMIDALSNLTNAMVQGSEQEEPA